MHISTTMALGAFGCTTLGWILYFAAVPTNQVAGRTPVSVLLEFTGLALAVFTLARGSSAGAMALAIPAAILSLFFFFLLTQRKTPVGEITVAVGDTLPAFEALLSDGKGFHSDSMAGQRLLLKFFRGSW